MSLQADSKAVRYCLAISRASGVAAIVIGGLALVRWLLNIEALASVDPGLATMKPNAAVCLVLLGVSLCVAQTIPDRSGYLSRNRRLVGQALAAVVAMVGLLTCAEYLLGFDLGIDDLLFRGASVPAATIHAGRMAQASALVIAQFGASILFLDSESRWGRRLSRVLVLMGTTLGLLGVVGYIYNGQDLYRFLSYSTVAPGLQRARQRVYVQSLLAEGV